MEFQRCAFDMKESRFYFFLEGLVTPRRFGSLESHLLSIDPANVLKYKYAD